MVDGKIALKTNSDYCFQVQGQMGVTGKKYTNFVVFTSHGHFIQRIDFDPAFWESMLVKLEWFWANCLFPELLTKAIKQRITSIETNNQSINPIAYGGGGNFYPTPPYY